MSGLVTRDTQILPITTTTQQGAAYITGSGTALDGMTIQEPFVILLDENDPGRKVSPAGEATLQSVLTQAQATVTALGGTLTVSDVATHAALAGTLTVSDSGTHAALAGTLRVAPAAATGAALSSFTAATTATSMLPLNNARVGVIVYNDSLSATLYIAYATAAGDATLTHFTVKLPPGGLWEMPQPIYKNVLSGIWDGTAGAARVTELV